MRSFVFMTAFALLGCQTSGPKNIESVPSIFSPESFGEFSFTQDESEWVHAELQKLDLKNGIQHDQLTFHSIVGRFQCHRDGNLRSCYARTRLPASPFLSAKVRAESDLSSRLLKFFARKRDDLRTERIALANIRCDFKGPKIPPFDKTDIKCHLDQPRLPNETVFEDFAAERLFFAINGERPTGTKVVVAGDVWCEEDGCKVRTRDLKPSTQPLTLSAFDMNSKILAQETSTELIQKLTSVHEETWAIANEEKSGTITAASSFKGPVRCESTLLSIKSGTVRRYYCRVSLQK